jgi:hypothetical protein
MPSVVIDRLEPSSGARAQRASDLARARAADRLGERTVWCATALPAGRGPARALRGCLIADGSVVTRELEVAPEEPLRPLAERLDDALRLTTAVASPTGAAPPTRLGRRERSLYAEGVRDGEKLAGDAFGPGDIVVLHDALTLALGEAVRGRGAHAVWEVNLAAAPGRVPAGAAWELLRGLSAPIDAFVMSWCEPGAGRARVGRIAAAMPAAGVVATKEIAADRAEAEGLHNLGWSALLADIVERDRGEVVGGTLHPRPAVPAR